MDTSKLRGRPVVVKFFATCMGVVWWVGDEGVSVDHVEPAVDTLGRK